MYYFIVNPASKSHGGMHLFHEIEAYLKENNVEYKAYFTKRSGHMQELVYDICNEHINDSCRTNIVILGGDGSFNEAMQGVISFDKVNIGYIPTGSSNDFARAMYNGLSPLECAKRIVNCKEPKKLDIGKLRYIKVAPEFEEPGVSAPITRYFNVSCGMGFDADVCAVAEKSKVKAFFNKLHLGKLVYGAIAVKLLFSAKPEDVDVILENEEKVTIKKCRFVVSMNTCYEGGGYKFSPAAVPDDGYLDICAVGNIGALNAILTLPSAAKGTHLKKKQFKTYHAKSIEIKSEKPLYVHTDGEVSIKANHINVSLISGGLSFLW